MNPQGLSYIVRLKFNGREYFLLWQDGGHAPDKYVVLPKTLRLLQGKNEKDILEGAVKLGMQVADQAPVFVDMDGTFKALVGLRSERPVSARNCQLLLDGWNTLEDMARSIGITGKENSDEKKYLAWPTINCFMEITYRLSHQ